MPSFRHRAILLPLLLLLAAAQAVQAAETPRTRVAGVAQAIEDHYFDAERGRAIADGLHEASDDGAFDALAAPQALAEALTARLKPLDRHFRVRAPRPDQTMARRPPPPDMGDGIERVDILPGNIGVLGLHGFADFEFGRDDQPARQAIDATLRRLAHTDAMVVDLRGNHGGSPAMVGYLASAFVAPGAAIFNTFHSREGTQSEAPAQWHAAPRTQLPLFVVIDAHTGSAAESFAYTLQQAGRATIVGEDSGGAANPGGPIKTPGGLVVFVPTGSPVNPFSHGNWEGVGVQPDVRVASDKALDVALDLARKSARRR
ncbi:MAG: S41 family peptidase [Luteimonas sp.]|nr:S41 family peptidase [Luteimonas sp.]